MKTYVNSKNNNTIKNEPPFLSEKNPTQEQPQIPINKELSNCSEPQKTIKTICEPIDFEDLKLQVQSGRVFNTENFIKKEGDI